MSTAHILVVEDEENLAQTLRLNLQLEKYEVSLAHNGREAMKQLAAGITGFNLVILDVMLPDMNGYDLCKEIRSRAPELPVMFLTARNQKPDKLEGLKLGADDYITKPFDLDELLLRVSNLIRRSKAPSGDSFSFGQCKIDFTSYDVIIASGQKLTLSRREIGLLRLLTANPGKVISRNEIIDKLWDPGENASSRTIDNYILSFRKYFEADPREPRHFHSIRGVGYKFSL